MERGIDGFTPQDVQNLFDTALDGLVITGTDGFAITLAKCAHPFDPFHGGAPSVENGFAVRVSGFDDGVVPGAGYDGQPGIHVKAEWRIEITLVLRMVADLTTLRANMHRPEFRVLTKLYDELGSYAEGIDFRWVESSAPELVPGATDWWTQRITCRMRGAWRRPTFE